MVAVIERAVGGPLHLLDGVHGGHADDGRSVLDDRIDGALDGGGVDQRADGVVDQDNIVGLGGQSGQGMGHRFLAMVAALDHADAIGEAELGDLGLDAFDLRLAHGHVDGRYPLDRGKGAQRMNQDGEPSRMRNCLGCGPAILVPRPAAGKLRIPA